MPHSPDSPDSQVRQLLQGVDLAAVHYADDASRARLEPVFARWAQGRDIPDWALVKQNDSRSVFRAQTDGLGAVYLKHFHSRRGWYRLRRALGKGDALAEMRFGRMLTGVVATTPVLAAYARAGREWMISQAIEPAEPSDKWHTARLADNNHAAIRQATLALAEIVARLHTLGVLHHDLHCGNVLVNGGPGNLVLTDLHRISRRRLLGRRSRAANLAQLMSDRVLWTTRTQRLRFLRHYLRASHAEGTLAGWVRLIEPLAHAHAGGLMSQRERRIFGTNRYFARLRIAGYRTHVVLASKRAVAGSAAAEIVFTAEDWRDALANPEALINAPGGQVIKQSPSGIVVRRTLSVGGHELDVYIKRPARKRLVRWVTDCFRRSRPLRAFRLGHALLARHIPNALPLAAMERRLGPFLVDSLLVTEAVQPSMPLHKFLTRHLAPAGEDESVPAPVRRQLGRQVLWQLGRMLRRMHAEGYVHRDLKASNMLVYWQNPDEHPQIVMVDLDGARRVIRVSRRDEFKDLMRLNVSLLECHAVNHAGRLRMLLGYLRHPGSGRINFKPYWRVIQQWSAGRIRARIAGRQKRQKQERRSQP